MYGVLRLSPVNTIFIPALRIFERFLKLISENKSYKEAHGFVNKVTPHYDLFFKQRDYDYFNRPSNSTVAEIYREITKGNESGQEPAATNISN